MALPTDIYPVGAELRFLPVRTRVPLKFGPETMTEVTCARVALRVSDASGRTAVGWGETPLSVQWVWPTPLLSHAERDQALQDFCRQLTVAWAEFRLPGHALEVGHGFLESVLPRLRDEFNAARGAAAVAESPQQHHEPLPYLAALVCNSAFDIALHDAYGQLHGLPTYQTYTREFLNSDLSRYLEPSGYDNLPLDVNPAIPSFVGRYPNDYLVHPRAEVLPAWHLVGGMDLLDDSERTGKEPDDGYPVTLRAWIEQDGLNCLKVKLRGNDWDWDYQRLVKVGAIAMEEMVDWLTADFNCTVQDTSYVNAMLDRLARDHPRIYGMLLYVEQPFPYDLEANPLDVRSVSARKPLFLDESAHDWTQVRLGRTLGWSGVALKTCKTQTGAILSLCWARAHGMTLMVQDLSNPMLAQIPHVLLAAHAGTIMGVETNSMQFYPEASRPEQDVHPGLYQRRGGMIQLQSVTGPGFGYRLAEIQRNAPPPAASAGQGVSG